MPVVAVFSACSSAVSFHHRKVRTRLVALNASNPQPLDGAPRDVTACLSSSAWTFRTP